MQLGGVKLDLSRVTIPIYELFTKEDHIAPAASVFRGSKLFGGPVRLAMAGSGHIAGVVNPPAKKKYQYWTGGTPSSLAEWMATATERRGPGGQTGPLGSPAIRGRKCRRQIPRAVRYGRSKTRRGLTSRASG